MKTKNLHLYFLMVAAGFIFILSACTKDDNLAKDLNSLQTDLKSGNGPSANGQGAFYYNGKWRHFTFHAITMPNGSVQGSGVRTIAGHQSENQIKFNIDCLYIKDGNNATMSGVITSSTVENWPAGTPVIFRVIDNGEGSSNPDQITLLTQCHNAPDWWFDDCSDLPDYWGLYDIESGNFKVNP
jgi:hypothetical protein